MSDDIFAARSQDHTSPGINMTSRQFLRSFLILLLTGCIAACAGTPTNKMGMPWYPQQPGNVPETTATPQPSQQPAQPARTEPAAAVQQASRPTPPPSSLASSPASSQASALPASGNYTQATRHGDLLFLSGQIAFEPQANTLDRDSTIEQQTDAVMKKIGAILDSHRLTMANVVQATVYLANINDLGGMNAAYEQYFRGNLPSRTVVEVARLPRGALVEITVVAGR